MAFSLSTNGRCVRPSFDRNFDVLFDTYFNPTAVSFARNGTARAKGNLPVNIFEGETGYELTAEVPGVSAADLDISITGNELTISVEKRETLPEGLQVKNKERVFGKFSRTIQFPTDLKQDGVKAELEHGVLRLTVPKAEQEVAKKIQVNVKN